MTIKTKLTLIVVFAAAFAAGYFLGCNQTKEAMSQSWKRSYLHQMRANCDSELQRTILILTAFRESNPSNGVVMLESRLDGNLLTAAGCDVELQANFSGTPSYIQVAHDYRAKYPWTNPVSEIDAKVRKILSTAK